MKKWFASFLAIVMLATIGVAATVAVDSTIGETPTAEAATWMGYFVDPSWGTMAYASCISGYSNSGGVKSCTYGYTVKRYPGKWSFCYKRYWYGGYGLPGIRLYSNGRTSRVNGGSLFYVC